MLDLLDQYSRIVKDFRVLSYEQEGETYRLKMEISFIDDSTMFLKEYIFENRVRKYSYHWADSGGVLICRWDNAPHWKSIPTFPHHKHVENEVVESIETTAEDVLSNIQSVFENQT